MKVLSVVAAGIAALAVVASASAGQTSFEQTISGIASEVTGKSVALDCMTQSEWEAFAAQQGFDPARYAGRAKVGGTMAWFSPDTCATVEAFSRLANKQSARDCSETQTKWVKKQVVKKVKRCRRVKINGKWVKRCRWVKVKKTEEVPVDTEVPVLCPTWKHIIWTSNTLSHETQHLRGFRDEAQTECYAMQYLGTWMERLGASPALARQAMQDFWELSYPLEASGYSSAECRENGSLDLTPGDGVWP